MAAPVATARQAPAGIKLRDGKTTLITFTRFPAVKFWEKAVTPGGVDGGDFIEQTTMWNDDKETFWPQQLSKDSDITATVAYDPAVQDQFEEMINQNDQITITHPDGSTTAKWGALKKYELGENKKGEQPTATITIGITSTDNSFVERKGVTTSVAGT